MMTSSDNNEQNDENKYAKAAQASIQSRRILLISALTFTSLLLMGAVMLVSKNFNQIRSKAAMSTKMSETRVSETPTSETFSAESESSSSSSSIGELEVVVRALDARVREIRKRAAVFETDGEGQRAAKALQQATRQLLRARYGSDDAERYRVLVELEFPPGAAARGGGAFTIELAPSALQPHSIHAFLEMARRYSSGGGAFHRVAPHVLQVMLQRPAVQHLAFQEYSPDYPHAERTVGYAGRPSGPAWYVNIIDNTKNHGPGSQQKQNPHEADSCFGRVIDGYEQHILRIPAAVGGEGKDSNGFLNNQQHHVVISKMTIHVPTGEGGRYTPWQE